MSLSRLQQSKLSSQLDKWQQDLVNLTKRNKLLYFKHVKTASLEISAPSAVDIHSALGSRDWAFHLPPIEEEPGAQKRPVRQRAANELETTKRTRAELQASLRTLERTSNQMVLDTGLWVLYLGFGMLRWVDPADRKMHESPLLLQPVQLVRPGSAADFLLRATDDEPVINPALRIKLANDYQIELPDDDEASLSLSKVLANVRAAVRAQPSWSVEERVVLTTFSFHKEAMYRDLLDNRDAIADHPLVQVAAVGPSAGVERFSFEPVADDRLDDLAAPEDLVSIRDADSTQRKCIVAARDGRSFVMDGPPGTGKSQTISNIIAELLFAGKTVLFVSEKAAALEVVANRLGDAGLSDFVLGLHSHKATRKAVAEEFGQALSTSPKARTRFTDTDRAKLIKLRKDLSAYAIAVNRVRSGLGQSLHQVVGRIVQLQSSPHAPVSTCIEVDLTPEGLNAILDVATRLGGAWRPVTEGESFLWRSLRDSSYSAAKQQRVESLLDECERATTTLRATVDEVHAGSGLGWSANLEQAARTRDLLLHISANPRRDLVPLDWIAGADLVTVAATAATRRGQVTALDEIAKGAKVLAGDLWKSAPTERSQYLRNAYAELTNGSIHVAPDELSSSEMLTSLLQLLEALDLAAVDMQRDAAIIARAYGIDVAGLTVDKCSDLAELVALAGSATPPEPSWLDPFRQAALTEAASVLGALISDYRESRQRLAGTFTEGILDLDLAGLHARLSASGGLKKLGGTYRADKKTLSSCVVGGKVTTAVVARLPEAIAWAHLRVRLGFAESTHASALGSYYQGPASTDLDRLERALTIAQRAVELCGRTVPAAVAGQLGLGGSPSADAAEAGLRLGAAVAAWRSSIEPVLSRALVQNSNLSLADLRNWAMATRPHLASALDAVNVTNAAVSASLTTRQVEVLLSLVDQYTAGEEALRATASADSTMFGAGWNGASTDFEQLHEDIAWALVVSRMTDARLDAIAAQHLLAFAPAAETFADLVKAASESWGAVADLFVGEWRAQLTADSSVSWESTLELVADLRDTVGDIEVWERYSVARSELLDLGFTDVVSFMESSRVPADQVPAIVERSVLESWADQVIASDRALKTLNPDRRNNLVQEFQELDRALVANAAAQVVNACSARRPSSALGAAGVIRREAEKRSRHKPIRALLDETREVALALKPCFMMSPLSVSQFLPSDFQFDVVIFDEASQVRPADAINCIYRGSQLIVAGDPKQLPPSSFFDRVADEGTDEFDEESPDDFESVLDLLLGSGLPPLSLQWHYRSQHESLISFSNYSFYEGRLHTFPGAVEEAADVGVELIKANGVYRRGGAKDNVIEAGVVVDRVLFHRRNHPDLSLGVVAFSSAQESAIVAEIERRLPTEPELGDLVGGSGDRLGGFFVKNLENVQGDERDIIIFSIGYGPDEAGKFTEQLGPLGQAGGERRLNVAITRARRRVEVVASISAGSFPGTSSSAGIRQLQRYLDFAERGVTALALDLRGSLGDTESVFEEEVLAFATSLGYTVTPQVGVAGYRVDLAVRHPAKPGEFVLGIECDGAAYHSSRVARDRDRLRQEILEGLGWRIYRIWGPSWFRDRRGQEAALRTAIEEAIDGVAPEPEPRQQPSARTLIEFSMVDLEAPPSWAVPYEVSSWEPGRTVSSNEIHLVPTADLARGVSAIARVEGPVHEEVLRRRLLHAYGASRTGARIDAAFNSAIATAIGRGPVERIDGDFLQLSGTQMRVRTPAEHDEETRRKAAHVPSAEVELALCRFVLDSHRVDRDELRIAVGRLFGWKRVGAEIDSAFERALKQAVMRGRVTIDGLDVVAPH